MNTLIIREQLLAESTNLHYVVESSNPTAPDIAEGTHTLHDSGNKEIRDSLRSAAISALELQFACKLEDIRPVDGVELPDERSLGRYRDNLGNH
jgi:hypothetical protein